MFEYIKLQIKLRWGRDRSASKKSGLLTAAVGILVICAALSLIYLLTRILADNLEETTAAELSVLFIAVLEAALFVMSVCMQVRWLYRPADLEITARFPITPFKIYVANIALVYFNLLIYAALFFVPVLTVFGLALKIFTAQYFFGILICAFLSPALPFAISLVVAIPVMYALSLLENKNTVKLILFIVVLAAFFVLYNYVLSVLAEYFLHNNVSSETSIVWTKILKTLNGRGNLTAYLGDVLFLNGFWKAFGILLGASLGVSAAGLALAKPVYDGAHRKMLEGAGNAFRRRSGMDGRSAAAAMFRHQFKEILRTRSYAYFYLGIAVATPVMVFFCNRLVNEVGEAQLGEIVNFGASVLVMTAFMGLISAFSAAAVSMEGERFYITKIVPVSYRAQLAVKGALNLAVSFGALLVSCVIVASLGFVSIGQTLIIGATEFVLAAGFVLNGLNLNVANPNVKPKANGEIDEINVSFMMFIGVFISAAAGALAIILPFFWDIVWVYLLLAGVALVYAGVNLIVFILTASKRYARIEG